MGRALLLVLLSSIAVLASATPHAPLPPALMSATTIYIDNNTGQASIADRCYDELSKWGRFKVVGDPKSADLIFQIGSHTQTAGYSGHVDSDGNTNLYATRAGFTTISVADHSGLVLWSDTRRWGNLFTGYRSATRGVIKELRKRMEEQGSMKYPDLYALGHELGYPDQEIAEAINSEGAEKTRSFLQREKEKKK